MADEETETNKTVTIKIDDTAATHRFAGSRVPVAVNGQIAHIPFNEETEVGEHIISALTDAGIPFTVVGSKDSAGSVAEGVSVTDPLALTVPADDPAKGEGEGADHAREHAEELNQDSETIHVEGDIPVEGLSMAGKTLAPQTGENADDKAGETGGDNADTTTDQNKTGDEGQGGDKANPMLDQSIPDLKEALKGVTSTDELDALLAAEKAGKTRTGAIDAIEARKAELTAA